MKWNTLWHPMLQRKLFGWRSSSTNLEWFPHLKIQFYCIMIVLVPLLKSRNPSPIKEPNIFCVTISWSVRSSIEVTLSCWRLMERKIWCTPSLKLSGPKSLMTISRRWVLDTVLIDFSLSRSCWKIYPKINYISIDYWAFYNLYINY